jgi:hypothetical protein
MSAFDSHLAAMNESLAATFGESATYTPSGGSSEEITGIWDFSDEAKGRVAGQHIAGIFTVAITEFTEPPAKNATFVIRGITYVLRDDSIVDDGGGMLELLLRRK